MAQVVVAQRMYQRRDTAATWAAKNPTLQAGEIGVELPLTPGSPVKTKIGDGVRPWNALPYFGGGGKASEIEFDPTGLPISSSNVQGAVAELSLQVDELIEGYAGGPTAFTAQAGEALSNGVFCCVRNEPGGPKMYRADHTDPEGSAIAYVTSNVALGASGIFFRDGVNSSLNSLVPGETYVLQELGAVVPISSLPFASGTLFQVVGVAITDSRLAVSFQPSYLRG